VELILFCCVLGKQSSISLKVPPIKKKAGEKEPNNWFSFQEIVAVAAVAGSDLSLLE
jgi:hypothetical protein